MGTRERIVDATSSLLRERGYAGTGVKAILAAAEAPYGSLYHFFPNGKEELGAEAIRAGGATYRALVEGFFPPGSDLDVVQATRDLFDGAAVVLEASGYEDACPIATVALEVASTSEPLRIAAADSFESWLAAFDDAFVSIGVDRATARELGVNLFCLIEGAFLLARTTRSAEPMRTAGDTAVALVRSATGR